MATHSDPKVALLRRVPFLRGKSDAELVELAKLADEAYLPPGHVLMHEGTTGREAMLILEGWAAVSRGGATIAAVGPGELVGEMSMLDHEPRTATVTAKTDMKVLVLGGTTFPVFIEDPAVSHSLATQLTKRLRDLERAP